MMNFLMSRPINFMALSGIFSKLNNGSGQATQGLYTIAGPALLLIATICGLIWAFGGDQMNLLAKRWLGRVAVGLAIIGLAPEALKWLNSLFGNKMKF